MIKVSVPQENIAILNVYASKHVTQKPKESREKIKQTPYYT